MLRPLTAELAAALLAGTSSTPAAPGFPTDDDASVLALVAGGDGGQTYVIEHDGHSSGTLGVAGAVDPDGAQEIGYGLVAGARGKGLGTEAVAALCSVLERRPGTRLLTAQALVSNEASLRLLARLGFVEIGEAAEGHRRLARACPGSPAPRARLRGRHVC